MKSILLATAILLLNTTGFAQAQTATDTSAKTGTVYFIRATGYAGSATAFTAFVDGNLACKLNNKKFSVHQVPAGEHVFTVQFAGKKAKEKAEPITINVEEGKTYYIQMVFQTGFFVNNLYCQEVTENSAKTVLKQCQEDTKCL